MASRVETGGDGAATGTSAASGAPPIVPANTPANPTPTSANPSELTQLDPLCPRRSAGPSAVWCFQCGADYTAEVTNCLECGVLTLPYPPQSVTKVGDPDENQLIYDLHEWSWESRSLMASFMFTEELVHAWQGASLVVREADESKVDELVARVKDTELPVLNHAAETVEYEVGDLSDVQTDTLTKMLADESIPHEFNIDGDLVVQGSDEQRVEQVINEWSKSLEELDEGEFGPGLAAVNITATAPDLLGELFDCCRRMEQNVGDVYANREFLRVVVWLHMLELPFGFSKPNWRKLRNLSADLAELLFPGELDDKLDQLLAQAAAAAGVDLEEIEDAADEDADSDAGSDDDADEETDADADEDTDTDSDSDLSSDTDPEFDADVDPEFDDLVHQIKKSAARLRKFLKDFV